MAIKAQWWENSGRDLACAVQELGERLWTDDTARRDDIEINLRRFSGRSLKSKWQSYTQDPHNVRLNITKSAIETLMSKVGSNRPRPRVLVNDANHSLRTKAKKLQRFLDGGFKQADVYKVGKLAIRDAMLTGTGMIHVYGNVGKRQVMAERVFSTEIVVDSAESLHGCPQTMVRTKFIDKDVLKGMFPDKAKAIEALSVAALDEMPDYIRDAYLGAEDARCNRMVQVWEAWKLAVVGYTGAVTNGRHALAAGDVLLHDEEWEHDFFPFAIMHWCDPVVGFWGDSAAGEIRGLEKEVNTLLQKIQKSMRIAGQPWIMKSKRAGKVSTSKITDEVGLVIEYDGSREDAPTIQTHQPVHPQLIEQMWTLHQKAYQQLGTNEYQAAAVKPPGIESGKGLQQLSEEHLIRFKDVSQRYEQFLAVDVARQFVRAARDLDAALKAQGHKEGYVVRATANKTAIRLQWQDCGIGPDDFFIETWPTSILPITPSGRTEVVAEWQAQGWISPQRAMQLADLPDLDSELSLATADSELVEWQLEQMLDDGKDVYPEQRQNLTYALQRGTYALERAMQDDTPEANLDKVRMWLSAIEELMAPPQPVAPPATMTGAEPMAGMAGPMPMAPMPPPMAGGIA